MTPKNMTQKKALLIIILFFNHFLHAQSKKDSIIVKNVISELKHYSRNVKDSALFYIEKANKTKKTLNNSSLEHHITYQIANSYMRIGKMNSSLSEVNKLIENITPDNEDCNLLCNIYSLKGYVLTFSNKNTKALLCYNKAYEYAKLCNDDYKAAVFLNNISLTYYINTDYEKAKLYSSKALVLFEKLKDLKDKNKLLLGITIYKGLIKNPNVKKAKKITCLNKATRLAKKTNNYKVLAKVNRLQASYYGKELKDYNTAIKFYKKALFYEKKEETKIAELEICIELSSCLIKINNIREARKYYRYAIDILDKLSDDEVASVISFTLNDEKTEANILSKLSYDLGYTKKAYKYSIIQHKNTQKYIESKYDSISSFYSAKFKSEQQDKEIAEHKLTIEKEKQKRFLWIFGAIITAISLIAFFYRKQLIGKNKKRLAEELLKNKQKLHAQQTKFIQNIAHEVKTPITIVNGIIETAISNNSTKDLSIALKNTNEINTSVDSILKSLDNNNIDLVNNSSPTNLEGFIHQLVTDFSPILNFNKVSLTNEYLVDSKYLILLDKEKTQKILSNFLTNALKHSNKNSKIILKTTRKDDNLLFSVTDFGKGIPLEEQEKIFERFYIGKGNQAGGFGIGLSLAKELATFMQGTINVDSTLNKQTTFTLSLPLQLTETTITESKNNFEHKTDFAIPYEKKHNNKTSVLVVDDNLDIINYYKSILDDTYNCAYCSNGLEAIKLLKKQSFSLIVSDIMMPKVDGYQFRKLVKELPEYKTIPFIFVTAKTFKADKHFALKLGVDDYITKPFNTNELLLRIENLIENSKERLKVSNKEVIDGIIEEQKVDPFIEKTIETIIDNIEDPDFSVSSLADKLNYSQRQFNRIIQKATGLTPVKLILEQRLKQAYMLLNDNINTRVSDVQYKVGINNASYFNKKFKERFGVNPSELVKR